MKENFLENKNSIEISANYEGNETLLLQKRLQDPEIKKQLIDTLWEFYNDRDKSKQRASKDPRLAKFLIATDLELKIREIFSSTGINTSIKGLASPGCGGGELTGIMHPYALNETTKERWTTKQLSIAEAHEKGHSVRSFHNPNKKFIEKIHRGFDFSKAITHDFKDFIQREKNEKDTVEKIVKILIEYYKEPMEIMERMSQLKNYFGMRGAEKFTKEHLDYARNHYIKDTGTPSIQIQPFFNAITSESEQKFLELINTLGI